MMVWTMTHVSCVQNTSISVPGWKDTKARNPVSMTVRLTLYFSSRGDCHELAKDPSDHGDLPHNNQLVYLEPWHFEPCPDF